jgi:nucleoside-diphosphate-sugar epimerase
MRVLVTGASGFLGRHCLPRLVAGGAEVHAVARIPIELPGIRWHAADLLRAGSAFEVVKEVRPTHLLWLAWCTELGDYWTSPENEAWKRESLAALRVFLDGGGSRAVMAGSCAEYDWSAGVCAESTQLDPATLYGRAKRDTFEAASAMAGSALAWARLFFLYGPHERPQRLVPSVIRALLESREAECSDGRQRRDFLYVDDAADALVRLLGSPHAGAVNVASGGAVAVREVVQMIADQLGRSEWVRFGARPTPADEPAEIVADTRLLNERVGWRPSVSLADGIARSIAWWRR